MSETFDPKHYYTLTKGEFEKYCSQSEYLFLTMQKNAYKNLLELALEYPNQIVPIKGLKFRLEEIIQNWQSRVIPQLQDMRTKYESIKHPAPKESIDMVRSYEEGLKISVGLIMSELRSISTKTLIKPSNDISN